MGPSDTSNLNQIDLAHFSKSKGCHSKLCNLLTLSLSKHTKHTTVMIIIEIPLSITDLKFHVKNPRGNQRNVYESRRYPGPSLLSPNICRKCEPWLVMHGRIEENFDY